MYDKWPRPLNERPRARRLYRSRDKVTGNPDGKRWCPAYNGIISAMTCRESRGNVAGCDARCPYYAPLLVVSGMKSLPLFPLHKCYVSHLPTSGVATAVVSRRNPDGTLRAMFLELDLWKVGIQDCFVDARVVPEQLERELKGAHPPFEEKTLPQVQELVKWAERISREVGWEIPWEYRHWNAMLDEMNRVPEPQGSLYRCAKCAGDLPAKAAELMKEHALQPGVHFYIVCRKCGGEFEDDW